jgi:hypothetical protein
VISRMFSYQPRQFNLVQAQPAASSEPVALQAGTQTAEQANVQSKKKRKRH